eukprot:12359096-Karenia_brevis.AAC.1
MGSSHCIANLKAKIPIKIHCAYMPHAGENKDQKQKDDNVFQEVINSHLSSLGGAFVGAADEGC